MPEQDYARVKIFLNEIEAKSGNVDCLTKVFGNDSRTLVIPHISLRFPMSTGFILYFNQMQCNKSLFFHSLRFPFWFAVFPCQATFFLYLFRIQGELQSPFNSVDCQIYQSMYTCHLIFTENRLIVFVFLSSFCFVYSVPGIQTFMCDLIKSARWIG